MFLQFSIKTLRSFCFPLAFAFPSLILKQIKPKTACYSTIPYLYCFEAIIWMSLSSRYFGKVGLDFSCTFYKNICA